MRQTASERPTMGDSVFISQTTANWIIATTFVLLATTAQAQEAPSCGCANPPSADELLAEGSDSIFVLARVAGVEGAPRPAHTGNPDDAHPYPWLRYRLSVAKAWNLDGPSFYIDRPWARCGSVLTMREPYLIGFKRPGQRAEEEASAYRPTTEPENAVPVDSCSFVLPLSEAGSLIEQLGSPSFDAAANRKAVVAAGRRHIDSMIAAREHCTAVAEVVTKQVSMTPGDFVEVEISLAGQSQMFAFAQNGTSANAEDEVLVQAHNPTNCWLQVQPAIKAEWSADSSVWRVFPSGAGLTIAEGHIPPYWSGVVSLGKHPWIREAEWQVQGLPLGPSRPFQAADAARIGAQAGSGSRQAAGSYGVSIPSIAPEPGSSLQASTQISGTAVWTPSPDLRELLASDPQLRLNPLFISSNGSMVMHGSDGKSASTPFQIDPDQPSVEIEFRFQPSTTLSETQLTDPLQLLFSIQVPLEAQSAEANAPTGTRIIAMSKPITYRNGITVPATLLVAPQTGPWYTGGRGDSCDEAIVIKGVETIQQGIAAERAWWRKEYPGATMDKQGVSPPFEEGGPAYDLITLTLQDESEVKLCFDITEFWGARAR